MSAEIDPAHTGLLLTLPAASPKAFLERHLARTWEGDGTDDVSPRAIVLAELYQEDSAQLRRAHDRLRAAGTPAPAASTYLAGWFGGAIGSAVGFALATAGAGLLPTPEDTRFHLHPDGWPMGLDLPARVIVAPEHPWAGLDGVHLADDDAAVIRRAIEHLVDTVGPVIDGCRGLAAIGRAGLWNEVADALGAAVAYQEVAPADERMVAVLRRAVAVDTAPWRARPALGFVESPVLGRVLVVQKGGCCLAYTEPAEVHHDADPEEEEVDASDAAYLERFPAVPGDPDYCTTCSLRSADDCAARQLFWKERQAIE